MNLSFMDRIIQMFSQYKLPDCFESTKRFHLICTKKYKKYPEECLSFLSLSYVDLTF